MRLADQLSARSIGIEARDLPDLVAYADPELLARVLDNVLSSAVSYNRDRGLVVLTGSAHTVAEDEWSVGSISVAARHQVGRRMGPRLRQVLPRRSVSFYVEPAEAVSAWPFAAKYGRARRIFWNRQLLHERDHLRDRPAVNRFTSAVLADHRARVPECDHD